MRDGFHPVVKAALVMIGAVALLLGLAVEFVDWDGEKPSVSDRASGPRRPALTRHLLEGVRVRSGDVNSPVISCQSAYVVKKKVGPFSFGAFNRLELEDFQLVFSSVSMGQEDQKPISDEEMIFMETLGASDGWTNIRSFLGMGEKVSGLAIRQFCIGVQGGAQIEYILQADRAEAKPDGTLHLTGCRFVDEQGRAFVSAEGILSLEKPVTLASGGRQVVIRDVIKALRNPRELHAAQKQSAEGS